MIALALIRNRIILITRYLIGFEGSGMLRILSIILVLGTALSAQADTTTLGWDFGNRSNFVNTVAGENNSVSNDYSSFDAMSYQHMAGRGWVASDREALTVSGWSMVENPNRTDRLTAVGADIYSWGSNGIGVVNQNESYSNNEHAIDNRNVNQGENQEFVLLSFAEEVALEGFWVGWESTYGAGNDELNIGTRTLSTRAVNKIEDENRNVAWQRGFLDNSMTSAINTTGSVASSRNVVYYSIGNTAGTTSKHWIVGLFQEVVSGNYDAFKLRGIVASRTTPTNVTEVPEPSTVAMFALGLLLLLRQQKSNKKFQFHA